MGSMKRGWTRSNVDSSFVSMGTKKITGQSRMPQAWRSQGESSPCLHQIDPFGQFNPRNAMRI
jgi:hypothetical protein